MAAKKSKTVKLKKNKQQIKALRPFLSNATKGWVQISLIRLGMEFCFTVVDLCGVCVSICLIPEWIQRDQSLLDINADHIVCHNPSGRIYIGKSIYVENVCN